MARAPPPIRSIEAHGARARALQSARLFEARGARARALVEARGARALSVAVCAITLALRSSASFPPPNSSFPSPPRASPPDRWPSWAGPPQGPGPRRNTGVARRCLHRLGYKPSTRGARDLPHPTAGKLCEPPGAPSGAQGGELCPLASSMASAVLPVPSMASAVLLVPSMASAVLREPRSGEHCGRRLCFCACA